ncbi:unnamed protein product [Schistocephalus solidus]|uniref:Uncharacterized protein n=1 Tax=Schistocephalus solidus TaxID=70667 RepID=A0A183T844_SCHSO|nr:unnamed protein product [Schistocephalus solidus]
MRCAETGDAQELEHVLVCTRLKVHLSAPPKNVTCETPRSQKNPTTQHCRGPEHRNPVQFLYSVVRPPSDGEIADAIQRLNNNKAPREYSIPTEIYKVCIANLALWHVWRRSSS